MSEYLEKIVENLTKIEAEECNALNEATKKVAEVIANGGLIFTFGCGHSHLPGLDAFYRAGGLANVSPMLDTDLMLHNGAAKSSRMEKMSGIGTEIYRRYKVEPRDMIVVFSASGKNQVPCEVAENARKNGVFTVGVSSSEYFEKGGRLQNFVDVHLDCKVPYGDACIDVGEVKMGGLSTATACYILNTVLIEGARRAEAEGVKAPIFLSGNIDGGREHNVVLEEKYIGRVKHL